MQEQEPLRIFIVYAHEDAGALNDIQGHFTPVVESEKLIIWYDGKILAGQNWDDQIKDNLRQSDIILLLISIHFFKSDYIKNTELTEALDRHREKKSVVIPVIVRPCVWNLVFEVNRFQALPTHGNPIYSNSNSNSDEAIVTVVEGVLKVAQDIRKNRKLQKLQIEKEKEAIRLEEIKKLTKLRQIEEDRLRKEQIDKEEIDKKRKIEEAQLAADKRKIEEEKAQKLKNEQIEAEKAKSKQLKLEQLETEKKIKAPAAQIKVETTKNELLVVKTKMFQTPILPATKKNDTSENLGVSIFFAFLMFLLTLVNYSIRFKFFSNYDFPYGFWYTLILLACIPAILIGILLFIFSIDMDSDWGIVSFIGAIIFLCIEILYPSYLFYSKDFGLLKTKITHNVIPQPVKPKMDSTLTQIKPQQYKIDSFTLKFPMVKLVGASFTIGNTQQDKGDIDECPYFTTVGDFQIGKYEITVKQWLEIMGTYPKNCYHKNDSMPITGVNYDDILEFINKLNKKSNKTYRLPTETEWEFAARGGKDGIKNNYIYAGSNSVENVAQYNKNTKTQTNKLGEIQKIGQLKPVLVGNDSIFDLSGNVREWCSSNYLPYPDCKVNKNDSNRIVVRGGAYDSSEAAIRVSKRESHSPEMRHWNLGFRLAHN
jgi:formylglycine-generating enzyme required for sulfatase activity